MQNIITVNLTNKQSREELKSLLLEGWKIIDFVKYKVKKTSYVDYIIEK